MLSLPSGISETLKLGLDALDASFSFCKADAVDWSTFSSKASAPLARSLNHDILKHKRLFKDFIYQIHNQFKIELMVEASLK